MKACETNFSSSKVLKTCYVRFVNSKYLKPRLATNKYANPSDTSDESVIDFVIKEIFSNQDKI